MRFRSTLLIAIISIVMTITMVSPAADVAFGAETTDATTVTGGTHFTPVAPPVRASYKGKNAKRIPVITYHYLVSNKNKKQHSSLYISRGKFKKQMKWLHDHHYRTLSMEEFYLWHQGKLKVPKKSVVITFDDGNYSVIRYALPTLKKYKMRATIFMVGSWTKEKTNKKVKKNGRCRYIGLDVMRSVSSSYPNFEFQSHTWRMHNKKKGKRALKYSFEKQNLDMKKQYEKFNYTFLAYPYGAYNKNTIRAAKANGIKLAFTYGKNGYAKKSQNLYKIRRIKIGANDSMSRFTRWFK